MIVNIAKLLKGDNKVIKQFENFFRLTFKKVYDLLIPAGMILVVSYKLLVA